jgi:hypothetical protein
MTSTTLKTVLNSFQIRNNLIIPSQKTFEKMNMTRQEYIFYKWSYYKNLQKVNSGPATTMDPVRRRKLFRRLV